jgi:tripartite-type tricarboxylate transporter receptor subunit TctC
MPTTAEAGFPQYQYESWFGLIGPRTLPRSLVNRIHDDTVAVLREPATREKISKVGAEARYSTPEEFAKLQRDEHTELAALIKETGMKVQ